MHACLLNLMRLPPSLMVTFLILQECPLPLSVVQAPFAFTTIGHADVFDAAVRVLYSN